MQVSFRAKFISPTQVLRQDCNNSLYPRTASFVQLDPSNKKDRIAINEIAKDWDSCNSFATDIAQDMNYDSILVDNSTNYYAITLQRDNFDRLDSDDILGVAEVNNSTNNTDDKYIKFLQIAPSETCYNEDRTFFKIGTALLKCIINKFKDCNFYLDSLNSTVDFYKENGFKILEKNLNNIIMFRPKNLPF